MKRRYPNIEKNKLSEFNTAEIRGWVIDRLVQIEYRVNNIIFEFFQPEEKQVFNEVLLNSSVIDFGGKAKILYNIGVSKTTLGKLRKIVSIRNAFAHASLGEDITLNVSIDEEGNENVKLDSWSIVTVMNAEGSINRKAISEYLEQFLDLNSELRDEFDEFLEALRKRKK
ncbi:hypothetical protein ABN763_10090 [Spongiivirga sp. MCCC 1A20706]|uniref:hypothetical protein n=1 Tax=Spongiivirga sp. MCCC 1A20706 TaxID=3160963 RepID=UPI0039778129